MPLTIKRLLEVYNISIADIQASTYTLRGNKLAIRLVNTNHQTASIPSLFSYMTKILKADLTKYSNVSALNQHDYLDGVRLTNRKVDLILDIIEDREYIEARR